MRQDRLIRLDAAYSGRSRRMRHPRQSHQGLVEMHMPIDEARQHQIAVDIEDRHAVRQRRCGALADRRDPPAGDPDLDQPPVGEPATGEECIERHDWFLAEVWVGKPSSTTLRHEPARFGYLS